MAQCLPVVLGFLLAAAHNAAASVGADLIYCTNSLDPVHFSWTVPDRALDREVVVVSPEGEALFSWRSDLPPLDEYDFWQRVDSADFQGANVRFSLSQVSSSDGGLYSCRENSVQGPVIPDCGQTLHYIEVPQPALSQPELPVLGHSGRLLCQDRLPGDWRTLGLHFHFQWWKDGQELPGQRHGELVFSPLRTSDQGVYSCRLHESTRSCATSVESNRHSFSVAVPPVLRIRNNSSDLDLTEGSSLTLTCEVESANPRVPPDGFSWTFSPSDSSSARQLSHTGDTLTLDPVTRGDSGQYTCQAWNDQHFKGQIPPGHVSVNVSVYYLENLYVTSEVEVREGDDVTLTCSVDSSATSLLQWLVDGVLRRYVTANLDRYVIVKASTRDSGNYTCRAAIGQNLELSQSTSVTVTAHSDEDAGRDCTPQVDISESEETATGRGATSLASRLRLVTAAILLC